MKRLTSILLTAVMIVNLIPNSLLTAYANTAPPSQEEQVLTEGELTPSDEPTKEIAEEESAEPTAQPSADPSTQPTQELEVEETSTPSVAPTVEPTPESTVQPSPDAALQATVTPTEETTGEEQEEIPMVIDEPILYAPGPSYGFGYNYDHIDVKIPAQYHVTVDGVDYVFTGAFDASTIVVTIKGVPGSTSDKVYRYSEYIGANNYSTRTEYDGSGNTMNEYNISLGNRRLTADDFLWENENSYSFGSASNIYIDGRIYFTATAESEAALALVFPYDGEKGQYYFELNNFQYTSVNECTGGNGLRSDGNSGYPSGLDMYLKIADVGTYITTGRMSIDKTVVNSSGREITPNVNFRYTVEILSGGTYIPVYFTQATSGIVYDGTTKTAGNTNIITVNPTIGPTVVSGLPVGMYRITELHTEGYVIVGAEGSTGTNYTLDYVIENKQEDNIPVAMFTNRQLTTAQSGVTVMKTVSGEAAGYQNPTIAIYEVGGTSPLWSMSVSKDVLYYPAITLEGGKTYQIVETNETTAGYVSTKSYTVNYGGTAVNVAEDGTFTVPEGAAGKIINIVVNNHYEVYVVPTGNLTIEKVFVDENGNELLATLEGYPDKIGFTVSGITGVIDIAAANGWTTTIYNIEEGTYTVTEDPADAQIPGYTLVRTEYAHSHENGTTCTTGSTSNTIDAHAAEDKLTVTNVYRRNVATEDAEIHDTFTVYKIDSDNVALGGAEFMLYTGYDAATHTGTGEVVGVYTSAADGTLVIDTATISATYLPTEGSVTYYLVETKAPDYYLTPAQYGNGIYVYEITIAVTQSEQLADNAFQTVNTFIISANYSENRARIAISDGLQIINMKNVLHRYTGSITVKKRDGTTGNGIADVNFTLYADEELQKPITAVATDADGLLTLDIQQLIAANQSFTALGTYRFFMQETTPEGYRTNDTVYTVEFAPAGTTSPTKVTGENYFEVIHTYKITVYDGQTPVDIIYNTRNEATEYEGQVGPVIKVDALDGIAALTGVKFVLYANENPTPETAIVEYITDGNGEFYINIDDLLTETATKVLANAGNPLPTVKGGTTTLYLQESQPLAGYAANTNIYPVTVTLTDIIEPETAENDVFTTTYVFSMTFADNKNTITVENTNRGDLVINKVITVDTVEDNDFLNGIDITVRVTTLDGQQYAEGWTEYTEGGQSLDPKIWYKDVTLTYDAEKGYSATLKDLIPGDYQVTEIVTEGMYVDGYALKVEYSGTNHDVATVVAGNTVENGNAIAETITNIYTTLTGDYHSDLVIYKIDGESLGYLGGAEFILYEDSNLTKFIGKFVTSDDGIAVINTSDDVLEKYLPEQGSVSLYLKETKAPAGYKASEQVYEIKINEHKNTIDGNTYEYYIIAAKYLGAGDEYLRDELTVENTKVVSYVHDSVEFYKLDSEISSPLVGAEFTFYGDADFVITTGYTLKDADERGISDGKFEINTNDIPAEMLPEIDQTVTYYMNETTVPDGYSVPEGTLLRVTITAEELLNEETNSYDTVYSIEFRTDETYTVADKEYAVVLNDREKANVFTYTPVTLVKYSDSRLAIRPENPATFGVFATTDSQQPLYTFKAGEFELTAESFANHLIGDADFVDTLFAEGEATTKAFLKEITAPIGYVLSDTTYELTIDATASDYNYNPETKLWERTIHFAITGISGLAYVDNEYHIVNKRDFTDALTIHDTLTVTKVDPDGNMLEGAEFVLTDTTGNDKYFTGCQFTISTEDEFMAQYIDILMTSLVDAENGQSATQNLMLIEEKAPQGYYVNVDIIDNVPVARSYAVQLTATRSIIWNGAQQKFQEVTTFILKEVAENGNEYEAIEIINNPINHGQLTINKVKFATDIPLEGAEFALFTDYDLTNPVDAVVTTDENGIAILSTELINPDLLPAEGTSTVLYLAETAAPDGYTDTDNVWIVQIVTGRDENGGVSYSITVDDISQLIVENHMNEKVTVKKYWENVKGTPDPIQVQLYKDGTPYGDAVTLSADNTWYYVWENLPGNAVYTVEEVKVPDGFKSKTEKPAENSFIITNIKKDEPKTVYYVPDTGDNTGIKMWGSLFGITGVLLIIVILMKRKKDDKR